MTLDLLVMMDGTYDLDRSVAVCMNRKKIGSSIPILLQCMDIWKKKPSYAKRTS